jgi:CRP-like cAMP-binding protein
MGQFQRSIRVKSSGDPLAKILIERLKNLAAISETAARAMASAVGRTFTANSGQDIMLSNTPRCECHVLLGGMAAPYKLLSDGKRQIVRFAFPGDFLDLDGYLGGTMDHSVATLGSCTIGVISHQALSEIARDHPDVAMALWRHTLADAAVLREWVVNVGRRSGQERLAHLLCEVFSRLQEVGLAVEISGNKTFSWYVRQQDLADATGLSSVHVNRSLQELRRRGLIEIKRNKVTIFYWPALNSLAGFKGDYLLAHRHGSAAIHQRDAPRPQR